MDLVGVRTPVRLRVRPQEREANRLISDEQLGKCPEPSCACKIRHFHPCTPRRRPACRTVSRVWGQEKSWRPARRGDAGRVGRQLASGCWLATKVSVLPLRRSTLGRKK